MAKLRCRVLGVVAAKGDFEGTGYDYTKLNVELPMVQSANKIGSDASALVFGSSDNIKQFAGMKFPCELELDMEVASTKNGTSTVIKGFAK